MNRDRELGMDRAITRRDFLDGVAVAVGGASVLAGNASAATTFPQDRPAIANSDAGASPHTDTALWEAHRAVGDVINRRAMPKLAE